MREIWCSHVLTQWLVSTSELYFFLPCNKFPQFLLGFLISGKKNAVCSCWVETSILTAVSKNSLFSDLAQTIPMTGRALSPQHDSQLQDTQPRQICLSWVFWVWCWSRDCSKATERKKRGTNFLGKLRLDAGGEKTYRLPKWNGPEPEGKAACSKKRMWPLLKEE